LQMPGMDGLALARSIQAEPMLAGVRCVLLSPLGRRLAPEEWTAAGCAACVLKPVKQDELADCLSRLSAEQGAELMAALPGVAPEEAASAAAPAALKPMRILLAEDDPVNRRVVQEQLQRLGYAADAVDSGADVLRQLKRNRYEVILLDCHMPLMDGFEVARKIRRQERGTWQRHGPAKPGVRIIALTARAMTGDRERCLAAGMDDYLAKPVRLETLREALERCAPA